MPAPNVPTKSFGANIPLDLYNEFKEILPGYGATQWFIENSVREFVEQCRAKPTAVAECKLAVQSMLEHNRAIAK